MPSENPAARLPEVTAVDLRKFPSRTPLLERTSRDHIYTTTGRPQGALRGSQCKHPPQLGLSLFSYLYCLYSIKLLGPVLALGWEQ